MKKGSGITRDFKRGCSAPLQVPSCFDNRSRPQAKGRQRPRPLEPRPHGDTPWPQRQNQAAPVSCAWTSCPELQTGRTSCPAKENIGRPRRPRHSEATPDVQNGRWPDVVSGKREYRTSPKVTAKRSEAGCPERQMAGRPRRPRHSEATPGCPARNNGPGMGRVRRGNSRIALFRDG